MASKFTRLTDSEWNLIKDELIEAPWYGAGRPRIDLRAAFDGAVWIAQNNRPWRDVPPDFGNWNTVYNYSRFWRTQGIIQKIQTRIQQHAKSIKELELLASKVASLHAMLTGQNLPREGRWGNRDARRRLEIPEHERLLLIDESYSEEDL